MRSRVALAALLVLGCADKSGATREPSGGSNIEPAVVAITSPEARPRIVLDKEALSALKTAAQSETPEMATLLKRCSVFASSDKSSGYLGLQWAEAVISLALCWHATGDASHADLAVRYYAGLLDDREGLGDGRGGDAEVQRNSGYPIRAHGFAVALGYDWLYNAKAMTPALRQRSGQRLEAWFRWYAKDGYLNDNPYANYYWGYMSSLAIAGLSLRGDTEVADKWHALATEQLEKNVIPAFADKLRGGTWAEGWQYGPLVAVNLAMVIRAYKTAAGLDYTAKFPWYSDIVRSQLHRLHPDRETAHSNGTHKQKPAVPSTTPLQAAVFVTAQSSPEVAAEARYLMKKLLPPQHPKYPWFALLASLSGDDQADPLTKAPLSYYLPGPGMTFARSSWDRRAIWMAFHAGAKIAVDHQHNDQGHFELWRGADALFVDGGDTDAFATINHNTLLVDDAGRTLNYSPNQGVWARDSKTLGYSDSAAAVVVVGDIGGAWDPKCALRGCEDRTVKKAIRTLVYVRPNILVIDDRIEVAGERDRVTWAAHARAKPQIRGGRVSVEVGESRADLTVLAPSRARLRSPKEPTSSETHIYRRNKPRGDVWRIEAPSPTGKRQRHFRVWMSAANRGAQQQTPQAIGDRGFDSIAGDGGNGRVSVLFANRTGGGVGRSPKDATVVVVGLTPNAKYGVTAKESGKPRSDFDCMLRVEKSGKGTSADAAGSITRKLTGCKLGE